MLAEAMLAQVGQTRSDLVVVTGFVDFAGHLEAGREVDTPWCGRCPEYFLNV